MSYGSNDDNPSDDCDSFLEAYYNNKQYEKRMGDMAIRYRLRELIKSLNEKEKQLLEELSKTKLTIYIAVLRAQLSQLQCDRDRINKILEE